MTMQDLLLDAVEQRVLRQLDVQFAMMIAADQPAVMLAAALLSKDAGEGHVCLPLSRLVVDEKMPPVLQSCFALLGERVDWQKILRESSAVGPGDNQAPLILTGERLYLNRLWRNELTVARFFSETNARRFPATKHSFARRWTGCLTPVRPQTGRKWRQPSP